MREDYLGDIETQTWINIRKNRMKEYEKELKEMGLPDKFIFRNYYNDIILADKRYKSFWIVKRRFLWVKKVAYIDNVNRGDYDLGLYDKLEFGRNIEVYDKEFYGIFKKFGKKHNFCCIKKCWDGAEKEYIKEYLKEMKK